MKIGEFSRGGVARGRQAVRAADHDMHPDAVLAPAGILEVDAQQLNVVFGTSRDTSDFVADCLESVVDQPPSRVSRRASVADRSGQRPGDRQFPHAVHEAAWSSSPTGIN